MDEVREIYNEAFGAFLEFDDLFFKYFGKTAKTVKADGKTVSVLFLLPCEIDGKDALYLFAAATKKEYRNKGFMKKLIKQTLENTDKTVFLKPANSGLIPFYKKLGFYTAKGVNKNGDIKITVLQSHKQLSELCEEAPGEFTLMFSQKQADKTFEFPFIMQ